MTISFATLNKLNQSEFTDTLAGIFEHSPWVPERAFARRPFSGVQNLHTAMVQIVREASVDEQLALLNAHPELAGKLAQSGKLTAASNAEQKGAGLTELTPAQAQEVAHLNAAYRDKFSFPFIIAVRRHTRDGILAEWRRRLHNSPDQERTTCLEQVYAIAELRLQVLFLSSTGTTREANSQEKAMGRLSTHVLDTAKGRPANHVRIDLSIRNEQGLYQLIKTEHTNADGRTNAPLLDQHSISAGDYELMFYVGAYFANQPATPAGAGFFTDVPVRFTISDPAQAYHVPLLVTPFGYSTYRGS